MALTKLNAKQIMVKKFVFGLSLAALAWGCDSGENEQLRAEVDSLRTELQTSQRMAQSLQEGGALIDGRDASGNLLRTDVVEGTSYTGYANRLKSIDDHIQQTEGKIAELAEALKTAKS